LTQKQLADAVGTSQTTISVIERGARAEPAIVAALAQYLGVAEQVLLTETPPFSGEVPPGPDLNTTIREARGHR
jgi:transcriptional regulator with XRE-family HTH domain